MELKNKSQRLLYLYGGLEGLAAKPPWLANAVVKALFTEAERVQILLYLFKDMERDRRMRLMRDFEVR